MLPGRRGNAYEGFPYEAKKGDSSPTCPECGASVSEFYKNREGEVVGCEYCIKLRDAWEDFDDED